MSQSGALDTDRYGTVDRSRRSTTRGQTKSQAKSGEVYCDFCTTRKTKAAQSCLVCLASYCEDHLQSHYTYPTLMKHKLVKATGQMREKVCAQHDKLLEAFCRSDQTLVCVLCMMDEHKHHDIVPAGTERTEKQVSGEQDQSEYSDDLVDLSHFSVCLFVQKQLGPTLHKSQQRIDQRIQKWQDLRQAVEAVQVVFLLHPNPILQKEKKLLSFYLRPPIFPLL